MPPRQVHHVQVVAHAGAVGRVVVVAVDQHFLPASGRDLRDVGEEVVRHPVGVLPDQPAGVGPHRVEVAQRDDPPVGSGRGQVGENALGEQLGGPVGVGGAQRRLLRDGHPLGVAVDGRRRAEHQGAHPVGAHGLAQGQQRVEVVAVVQQRPLRGLAHRLQPGAVHGRVDPVLGEDPLQQRPVGAVADVAGNGTAGDAFHPADRLRAAVAQVVDDDHPVAALQQLDGDVRSDVPGSAGEQYVHGHTRIHVADRSDGAASPA